MSITGALTGGLLDPGTPDFAGMSAKAEARRQALLNQGMAQINAIFNGGTVPVYSALTSPYTQDQWKNFKTTPQAGQLFDINKQGQFAQYQIPGFKASNPQAPMGVLGGGDIGGSAIFEALSAMGLFGQDKVFPRQEVNKQIRKGNLFTQDNQTFQGFTPEFYQQRQNAYMQNAMPQLNQQFQDATRAQQFGLANQGLLHSTQAGQQQNRLNLQAGQARQQVVDQGISQSQQLRQQVEQQRQNAINMLYQTSNPGQATQSAISSAAGFQQPSSFAPLANMFGNVFSQYYQSQLLGALKGQQGTGMGGFGGGGGLFDASAALPKY